MFIFRRLKLRILAPLHGSSRGSHGRTGLQLSVLSQETLCGTPHFDVEITEENVDDMAKDLIKQIKKSWDVRELQRTEFKGGLCNKIIGYLPRTKIGRYGKFEKFKSSDMILIRIYGEKTDVVKDHVREVRNIDELSQNNIIPPLYCTFSNGYCSDYIVGDVCNPEDFRNKDILCLTANCMAELHTVELSDSYLEYHKMESPLFDNIGYYLEAIPQLYYNMDLQKRFESSINSVERLREEVGTMFHTLTQFDDMTICYCHNDFHPINLIYNKREGTMHVIDHERGSPNFSAYDIGNFFNEFAGIHDINYTLYPTRETQFWWLRLYLRKVNEVSGSPSIVTNADVLELHNQVQVMSLVSHLFWVAWALFRAGYPVSEFDYMAYGIIRLNEYFKRKKEVQKTIGIIS